MNDTKRTRWTSAAIALSAGAILTGCMVGPDYKEPPAPVAPEYQDPGSDSVKRDAAELANWWAVFGDPVLNSLVQTAYRQNPNLQVAAVRVVEAQAQRGIAVGLMFPQQQALVGGYNRNQLSKNTANPRDGTERSFDQYELGGVASWELDIWGRFRRGIESADAEVLAAVASYDDALVSLIGDVATEYVNIRILQERLAVTRANVEVQKRGLDLADARFKGGTATELDRTQATVLLKDTEAQIPDLESSILQAQSRLCLLLGIPPRSLATMFGQGGVIPKPPASVAVGVPADLLRRRPDIRRAERQVAAQSALIGVAKSDLFPRFSLVGDIRLVSDGVGDLFHGDSLQAFGGPTFRWDVFNYGRIENNVRVQDARFQALIGVYEDTVLRAQSEVESNIAGYVGAQRQIVLLTDSVAAAKRAVEVAETQYKGGIADYTRVLNTQQALQNEQDRLVTTRGSVALNVVGLYRSLGGGWELRDVQVPLDPKIAAQMSQRTDWGKMLPTKASPGAGPATGPSAK